jgi:hypothetical protein
MVAVWAMQRCNRHGPCSMDRQMPQPLHATCALPVCPQAVLALREMVLGRWAALGASTQQGTLQLLLHLALAQLAADVAVDVHRGEVVMAAALAAHREALAGQQVTEVVLALGDDVVEVTQWVLIDLQEVGDARGAGEALDHFALELLVLDAGDHLEIVPDTIDRELRIEILEHVADVLAELTDEALAHRPALDGDFWEDFDDKFHWVNSARRACRK